MATNDVSPDWENATNPDPEAADAREGVWYSPSERDLEIYRARQFERKSVRNVAAEFGLSPTRIVQLVKQVTQWAAEFTPRQLTGLTAEKRLNLAEYNQRGRLEFLYEQSVEGWRQSSGPLGSVKTVTSPQGQREERTMKQQPGHVKYLAQAGRFANQLAALDGVGVEPAKHRGQLQWWNDEPVNYTERDKRWEQMTPEQRHRQAVDALGDVIPKAELRLSEIRLSREELFRFLDIPPDAAEAFWTTYQSFLKPVDAQEPASEAPVAASPATSPPEEACAHSVEDVIASATVATSTADPSPTPVATSNADNERKSIAGQPTTSRAMPVHPLAAVEQPMVGPPRPPARDRGWPIHTSRGLEIREPPSSPGSDSDEESPQTRSLVPKPKPP